MCGRFARFSSVETFANLFAARGGFGLTPRYNIVPRSAVLVARNAAWGGRELVALRWGLIPSWAQDEKIGDHTINARVETVAEKPAFRRAFRDRRCLVATDGFYEWSASYPKQPYFLRLRSHRPFAFAGLWERWAPAGRETVESCTILVTAADHVVAPIHDRMPLILGPADYDAWLDPALNDNAKVTAMLRSRGPVDLEAYPISTRVNDPKHDNQDVLEPVGA